MFETTGNFRGPAFEPTANTTVLCKLRMVLMQF